MKAGKLPPDQLQKLVLGRFAQRRPDVLVKAGIGEDCAVIDFGAEVAVISTDPITGASQGLGRLAVHVSCNDVAANGARPIGVQVVLLLPVGTADTDIARLMDEVESGCAELGIEVMGGHTEITSQVAAPVIVTTALGRADKRQYVTSAGARPGDAVVVTKGVGIEGTAILATDWATAIRQAARRQAHTSAVADAADTAMASLLQRASRFAGEISAVKDGITAAAFGVSAMHDVTEGGLYGALYEMGQASHCSFQVQEALVPIRPETRFICDCLQLDPLGLISSGTMLITCADGPGLVAALAEAGVPAFVIGKAVEAKSSEQGIVDNCGNRRPLTLLAEDELWRFLAAQNSHT